MRKRTLFLINLLFLSFLMMVYPPCSYAAGDEIITIEESEAEGADESSFDSEPEMVDLVSEAGEEMAEVAESAFDDEGMMKSAHEAAKAVLDEGEV